MSEPVEDIQVLQERFEELRSAVVILLKIIVSGASANASLRAEFETLKSIALQNPETRNHWDMLLPSKLQTVQKDVDALQALFVALDAKMSRLIH